MVCTCIFGLPCTGSFRMMVSVCWCVCWACVCVLVCVCVGVCARVCVCRCVCSSTGRVALLIGRVAVCVSVSVLRATQVRPGRPHVSLTYPHVNLTYPRALPTTYSFMAGLAGFIGKNLCFYSSQN